MTVPRTRSRRPKLESGAVATEQTTQLVPSDADVVPFPEQDKEKGAPPALEAALTGPQQAEVKVRSDTVDWANAEADRLASEAIKMRRLAATSQSDLTRLLTTIKDSANLDPDYNYRVDLERGVITAVDRIRR